MKKIAYICLFCVFLNAEFMGDAGYGFNFYRYTEPGLMRIDGTIHTIFARLTYFYDTFGIELNYSQTLDTNTKYNGSTMSGIPLVNLPSKDEFYSVDLKFGSRLSAFYDYDGLGYIGLGYRNLNNLVSGSGSYRRDQVYYYIPAGFYINDNISSNLLVKYGVEFRYIVLGVNKTHLGDAIPDANPYTLKFLQKNNFGLKVYTGFEYLLVGDFKIFVQLSADYWYLRESSTTTASYIQNGHLYTGSFVEPMNHTVQFGLEFGIGF